MRTICIANHKGGVGKTTTAINLSSGLARRGYNTLLIDCDPQGHATQGLGVATQDTLTLLELLVKDNVAPNDVIKQTAIKRLSIIPCDINLTMAESRLSEEGGKEYRLRTKLKDLFGFDFVIFDCPPNLGTVATNAFTSASEILMPVQQGFFSLTGIKTFTEFLERINRKINVVIGHKTSITGVLITFYSPQTNLTKATVKTIEEIFPTQLFKTRIPQNIKLNEAQGFGKCIFEHAIQSKGSSAYGKLVTEVIERGKSCQKQYHSTQLEAQ